MFRPIVYLCSVLAVARAAVRTASDASWIWPSSELLPGTDGSFQAFPGSNIAFRRVYTTPSSKPSARFATCQVAADNLFRFYVNEVQVLNGDFSGGSRVLVPLNPLSNLFAVYADNFSGQDQLFSPAGLLLACQIVFADGTIDTLLSDSSWQTSLYATSEMEKYDFFVDPGAWSAARVEGRYGMAPWGQIPFSPLPPSLDFSSSSWFWTVTEGGSFNAPPGPRAFRKTITSPSGKTAKFATILITADNTYTLWVNGNLVGLSPTEGNWQTAERYAVPLEGTSNTIAIYASNEVQGPAGVLVSILVHYSDGSTDPDGALAPWRSNALGSALPPPDFYKTTYVPSGWVPTWVSAYTSAASTQTWGSVTIPPV